MADEELDLDVKKGGKSTLIIILLAVVLLLAGAGIGAFMFLGGEDEAADGAQDTQTEVGKAPPPAHYLALKPEFTVNFANDNKASFLQVEITLMARESDALDTVQTHMPLIQNNILNILSSKTYDELITREGKQQLADEILHSVQQVVEEQLHKPGIEAVYFTSFVMQ